MKLNVKILELVLQKNKFAGVVNFMISCLNIYSIIDRTMEIVESEQI